MRGKVDGGNCMAYYVGRSRRKEGTEAGQRPAETQGAGADVKLRFSVRSSSTRVRRVSLIPLPPCFSLNIKPDSSRKPTLG